MWSRMVKRDDMPNTNCLCFSAVIISRGREIPRRRAQNNKTASKQQKAFHYRQVACPLSLLFSLTPIPIYTIIFFLFSPSY